MAGMSYIKSEAHIKDFKFEREIVSAYANGTGRIILEMEKGCYKDQSLEYCLKIKICYKIKEEVIPDKKAMDMFSKSKQTTDGPSSPLQVLVWTDRFELEDSYPFGEENLFVYASTSKLGDINVEEMGGVYQVKKINVDLDIGQGVLS